MSQLPSVVQYLNSASFEELDVVRCTVDSRIRKLEKPRSEIEQVCYRRGWKFTWFPHPGIPGTVFLRIWYNGKYQEFLGYHLNRPIAFTLAAERALDYFCGKSLCAHISKISAELENCMDLD